jgi:SRSO17 transposase
MIHILTQRVSLHQTRGGSISRAVEAGVPFGWVIGDEAYGVDTKLRMWLESEDIAHVLAVAKNSMVVTMQLTKTRVDRVIADLGEDAWTPMSCGDGAHGPRIYDWAVTDIRPLRLVDRGHWLLARRSRTDPTDIAYYVCFGPTDTTVEELGRVAGSRWAIEESFQTAKNETGLDHYQVRGYQAWYRHITLRWPRPRFSWSGGWSSVRWRSSSSASSALLGGVRVDVRV